MLSNKIYDVLKWGVMCVLPGIATLYAALSTIWGFPYGDEIVRTLSAVEVFLGTILAISNAKYKKSIKEAEDGEVWSQEEY